MNCKRARVIKNVELVKRSGSVAYVDPADASCFGGGSNTGLTIVDPDLDRLADRRLLLRERPLRGGSAGRRQQAARRDRERGPGGGGANRHRQPPRQLQLIRLGPVAFMNTQRASALGRRIVGAFATAIAGLVVLGAAPARAEDIDLYSGTGGAVAAPNVLFFLDNSSNWSAASQAWSKSGAPRQVRLRLSERLGRADALPRLRRAGVRQRQLAAAGTGRAARAPPGAEHPRLRQRLDAQDERRHHAVQHPTARPTAPASWPGTCASASRRWTRRAAPRCSPTWTPSTPGSRAPTSRGRRPPSTARRCTRRSSTSAATPGRPERAVARSVADATHYGPVRYSRPTHLEVPPRLPRRHQDDVRRPRRRQQLRRKLHHPHRQHLAEPGVRHRHQRGAVSDQPAAQSPRPRHRGADLSEAARQQRQERSALRRRVGDVSSTAPTSTAPTASRTSGCSRSTSTTGGPMRARASC